MANDLRDAIREYWEKNPNAMLVGGGEPPGTRDFFDRVATHRYRSEPCIREMAEFDRWANAKVLEIGCGMGTDLRQFAASGATVIGIDLTWQGIQMAKKSFELFGLNGAFAVADAEMLPFRSEYFDLVYSNGVIHHTPDTSASVKEIYRVTRTGGQARVMVYHRNSYFAQVIVGTLIGPAVHLLVIWFRGRSLPKSVKKWLPRGIQNLYVICAERGYSRALILSLSTDFSRPGQGNANPLSRAYTSPEARRLFSSFQSTKTFIRQLYYAGFLPSFMHRWAETRFGWFLFIRATK